MRAAAAAATSNTGLREASEGNSADSSCSAAEESDSSYSSAEGGDSDSSYSSAEEGVSDTEEDEEDEANWLDSLYLLLANTGTERLESFKASSSRQAKRIEKRTAKVRAQMKV